MLDLFKVKLRCLPSELDYHFVSRHEMLFCGNCGEMQKLTDGAGGMNPWVKEHFSLREIDYEDALYYLKANRNFPQVLRYGRDSTSTYYITVWD